MTIIFDFNTTSISKEGVEKIGRTYSIRVADDRSVTLRQINALRVICFGLKPISNNDGKDGMDVSGAGKDSPSQIIWDGEKFIAIPWEKRNSRAGRSGNTIKNELIVADLMADNQKRIGKPTKGHKAQMVPDPITMYDSRVLAKIVGRMKQRQYCEQTLVVDLRNVAGFTEDHFSELELGAEILECRVKFVR